MKYSLLICVWLAACATPPPPTFGSDPFTGDVQLVVHGLSCPLCSSNLYDALNAVPGVANSWGDLESGLIHVEPEPGATLTGGQLHRAVQDAGFTLKSVSSP